MLEYVRKNKMWWYYGNEGKYTEKTGTAKIQEIPLKEKVRALNKTEYGQILAGGDITIQGKNGGNSKEVINKDARISGGNIVKIETDKLKNIVSVGEKVKVKTGQESMYIKFEHTGKKPRKKIRMEVTYTRDIINTNKIADMVEEGIKPIPEGFYPPKMDNAEEIVRTMTYEKAYRIYGDPLPDIVSKRLERELDAIINNGFSFCKYSSHENISSTSHRSLIQKHILTFQAIWCRKNVCLFFWAILTTST